jgi:4a-hydroxytetrahydrobiopterin dehydratase
MAQVLTKKQIEEALVYLDGWVAKDNALVREFEFDSEDEREAFLGQVQVAADEADHHPELKVDGLAVTVSLSTHSAKGVTAKDTDLAESIQDLEP